MRERRNRCFPAKAVALWHRLGERWHVRLFEDSLEQSDNFHNVSGLDRSPRQMFSDPPYAVVGESAGS